jgi:hypothetical protein
LPGLSRGVLNNAANSEGLEGLARALGQGNHQRYLDDPGQLARPETAADGNNILGHLLGSKDASRALAGQAAASTGLDEGVLKKMLPFVAAMVMGGLSKQSSATLAGGNIGNAASTTSGLGAMLTSMLDADKDDSIADDLFSIAKRFF